MNEETFARIIKVIINLTVVNSFPIDASLKNIMIFSLFWGFHFSMLDFMVPDISKTVRESFVLILGFKLLK